MTPLLGYRLKLAQHALHRRMEEALKPLGLNPPNMRCWRN